MDGDTYVQQQQGLWIGLKEGNERQRERQVGAGYAFRSILSFSLSSKS